MNSTSIGSIRSCAVLTRRPNPTALAPTDWTNTELSERVRAETPVESTETKRALRIAQEAEVCACVRVGVCVSVCGVGVGVCLRVCVCV